MRNPFRPSPGGAPPELIGREQWLDEFTDALLDGPGSPARISLIIGRRGTGKTVLLTAMGERARNYGWKVIEETGTQGLLDRLLLLLAPPKRHITGININPVGGVQLSDAPQAVSLRAALTSALQRKRLPGVFISIDEVQAANIEEMRTLAVIVQHLVREDLNIALCLAGLPETRSLLIHDEVLTFLRRAYPLELTNIPIRLVEDSFREIFAEHGKAITSAQLSTLAESTYGYPYMIQLVGYYVWRASSIGSVTDEAVSSGIKEARERLGETVYLPAIDNLTALELQFLMAMSEDIEHSRPKDISQRLGRTSQTINTYRLRLLEAGIIENTGYGQLDFALPGLGTWLRDKAELIHAMIAKKSWPR